MKKFRLFFCLFGVCLIGIFASFNVQAHGDFRDRVYTREDLAVCGVGSVYCIGDFVRSLLKPDFEEPENPLVMPEICRLIQQVQTRPEWILIVRYHKSGEVEVFAAPEADYQEMSLEREKSSRIHVPVPVYARENHDAGNR